MTGLIIHPCDLGHEEDRMTIQEYNGRWSCWVGRACISGPHDECVARRIMVGYNLMCGIENSEADKIFVFGSVVGYNRACPTSL